MRISRSTGLIALAAMLASCGGGGGGGGDRIADGGGGGGTSSSTCSLSARQDWVLDEMIDWYLFQDLLRTNVNQAAFSNLSDYVDALTADARAEGKDRFFTHVTSIEEENAFFNSGSSAGFGVRFALDASDRLFITEAFENGPAFPEGMDRGTEILGIGTSSGNIRTVANIIATEGVGGLNDALGPNDPGVTRWFTIDNDGVVETISVTKAEFELEPMSPRYGSLVLNDNGKEVGYINLRTFISTADAPLRDAFADFRSRGIDEVVIDFRYNGGGLVSVAELMGDLMGRNRGGEVFSFTTFNDKQSANDDTEFFQPTSQSIQPMKIAFLGTGRTASASELVANAFPPYLGNDVALVGGNTFGKPVGQVARDRAECDDRLRVVAFKTENADGEGEYFDGLASTMPNTCSSPDDIGDQLGSEDELMIATALGFLRGASCTPISATGQTTQGVRERQVLLQPNYRDMSVTQREVPGFY